MLFLPDGISELPMPRYFENAPWLLTGRTRIPLASLSNSSLSSLRTPSSRWISRGTVICPLLVIVAFFAQSRSLFLTSPQVPYFEPAGESREEAASLYASQRLTRRQSGDSPKSSLSGVLLDAAYYP
jgi:hypothetical protein